MEGLLKVDKISFAVGDKLVLNDIAFELKQGAALSVMGHNGAGKTTLLKCIAGINRATGGRIKISGKDQQSHSPKALARILSYVPQRLEVLYPYTVEEFLLLNRYPHLSFARQHSSSDREIIDSAIYLCKLESFKSRMIPTLSGGELQRVLIAAAISQEPELILLDEPFSGLDPKYQELLSEVLITLKKEHKIALLITTHDINQGLRFSDKVLALKQGKSVFNGKVTDFIDGDVLKMVFEKEFSIVKHPKNNFSVVLPD